MCRALRERKQKIAKGKKCKQNATEFGHRQNHKRYHIISSAVTARGFHTISAMYSNNFAAE